MSSGILELIFLAMLWGPSFLFIKIAVLEVPPITMVMVRVGIAAAILYTVLRFRKTPLPTGWNIWRHFAILGFFANAFPFLCFNWGEIYVDSALASILNGTTPLFTMLIAHFAIREERLTLPKILGGLIGFQGLFLLVLPSIQSGVNASFWGIMAMTAASASYGIALVYAKKNLPKLAPAVAPTAQLTMATVYLLPLSLLLDKPWSLPVPSLQAVASIIALAVFGTAIAFIVYYHILAKVGATHLSMVTYLVPVFGIALGVLVLDEILSWHAYLGCLLILLGVMVANGLIRWPQRLMRPRIESV